jgi:Flp pilus assembly pilin Flp
MKMIKSFLKDESGMETLEYAIIAGLIAAAALVIYGAGWYNVLAAKLVSASGGT